MCGIVGFIKLNQNKYQFNPTKLIKEMVDEVKSRGPDFQNYWNDDNSKVYFGHSRLSIIDLSFQSNQPIQSKSQRWTIVFNGEIYNFKELRKSLNSKENLDGDTKVLISLIEKYGFRNTIERLDGMFAIAAWDSLQNKLYLTRDRVGEKPLYYFLDSNFLVFGSNINSLRKFPNKKLNLSLDAVKNYFKLNYIPAPLSIYDNYFKLNPASILVYDYKTKTHEEFNYWKLQNKLLSLDSKKLISKTEDILNETVKSQLISDVEVGTFLSGGIDSSLITIISSKFVNYKLKTFTLSSGDYNFDESLKAKKISEYIGAENLVCKLSKKNILDAIEDIPDIYGEPFGDSSQLPTMLISKFAKNYVKVVLGGDGGDEMFGGYNRHKYFINYLPKIKYLPKGLRTILSKIIKKTNPDIINNVLKKLNLFLPQKNKFYNYGYLLNKLGRIIDNNSYEIIFDKLISNNVNIYELFQKKKNLENELKINDIYDVLRHDILNYLPDDILCKVDRASMAYGLEVRTPFVSKKVIEFSQNIRIEDKIKNGQSKFLLKQVLKKYLPENLYKGQKRGFSVPINEWLKYELKDMLTDFSSKAFVNKQGIFNFNELSQIINYHFKGKINNEKFLWSYLIFQNWYSKNK